MDEIKIRLQTIISALLNTIPMVVTKDKSRIEAFIRAAGMRGFELATSTLGDPNGAIIVTDYFTKLAKVVSGYTEVGNSLAKFQFPKDLWGGKYKDPFRVPAAEAKAFAVEWEFPPEVIALMR